MDRRPKLRIRARCRAPLPDSQIGHRVAQILLLTRPDVLADLGMSSDQIKKAQRTATAFWLKAKDLAGKPDATLIDARRKLNLQMTQWIEAELSTDQASRLEQISLWWEGPSAFVTRPAVAMTLKLSKEQKEALQVAVNQREAARAKGHDEERLLAAKALEVLTPEQLITWKQLLGREFVPQLAARAATTTQRR